MNDVNTYAIFILSAILIVYALNLWADILNLGMLRDTLPEVFEHHYDGERYKKSQEYLGVTTRFGWFSSTFSLGILLVFWFSKGFQSLDHVIRQLGLGSVFTGILFMGALIVLKSIVSLPFSIYNTFVIEEKFGFNKTTAKIFITDMIKGIVLSVALGVPLLGLVLVFFEYAGPHAWLYCWITVVLFMLLLNYIIPTLIMPLFNRFTPIEEGELKVAIMNYARSIDFPLTQVFTMDGSKRSNKSNAFFTGLGKNKRIVLYDTLINQHTVPELVSILAHEMGHYTLKHIIKSLAIGIIQTGVMFYILSLCLTQKGLFEAFYMTHMSVYAGLIFFSLLFTPVDLMTGILMNMYSRKNEFEADRFAVKTGKDNQSLKNALIKLSVHSLGNLYPHPLFVLLNYSHPPILKRIESIQATPI